MASLTPAQKLEQAQDALHKMQTGQLVNKAEFDGVVTSYVNAGISELRKYVERLEREVDGKTGTGRRPIGVYF